MPRPSDRNPKERGRAAGTPPSRRDADMLPPMHNEALNLDGPPRTEPERELEPLPPDWEDQALALAEDFIWPREPHPAEQKNLERFSHLCLRFAYVERRVQGEILCQIPTHLAAISRERPRGLMEEAEVLAETERETMEIPNGPIEDLAELLDERGIKVIEWPHPAGNHSGAFLFAEDTGPALLVLGRVSSPVGRFILAHEYCHLLADVDPYENRFCHFGAATGQDALARGGRLLEDSEPGDTIDETSVPETRADLFARCLLLPREHFVRTLREFGQGGRGGFHADRLSDVGFYYGVSTPVVLNRLVDLQVLRVAKARAMAERIRTDPPGTAQVEESGDPSGQLQGLPRRFVNLSLALFLKRQISRDQLGVLLNADRATLEQFLSCIDLSGQAS